MVEDKERIIFRENSRIILPRTYELLKTGLNPEYKLIVEGLINTGARGVEFWEIVKHPEWFHATRQLIDLPKEGACGKEKCLQTDRTILLTKRGVAAMDAIYASNLKEKDRVTFFGALQRACIRVGINPKGINPKSFRKDAVSWLMAARKQLNIDSADISLSMGHDIRTLIKNYQATGFTKLEVNDCTDFFRGWGVPI